MLWLSRSRSLLSANSLPNEKFAGQSLSLHHYSYSSAESPHVLLPTPDRLYRTTEEALRIPKASALTAARGMLSAYIPLCDPSSLSNRKHVIFGHRGTSLYPSSLNSPASYPIGSRNIAGKWSSSPGLARCARRRRCSLLPSVAVVCRSREEGCPLHPMCCDRVLSAELRVYDVWIFLPIIVAHPHLVRIVSSQ